MSRFLTLAAWLAAISMVSVSTADETSTDTTDYTCDPNFDYAIPKPPGSCPTEKIQDGVCDNPNHGGDDDSCLEQDCIDCNKFCKCERIEYSGSTKCCIRESLVLTSYFLHYSSFVLVDGSMNKFQRHTIQYGLFWMFECQRMLLLSRGCYLSEFESLSIDS